MTRQASRLHAATRAVRAGIDADPAFGAVTPNLVLSANFSFEGFGRKRNYDYTRSGNPTRSQLATAIAELECGAGAVVTSTGMSAVTLVLQLVKPGELVVAAHDCYGGTQRLLRALAARGAFDLQFADLTHPDGLRLAARAGQSPKIVWVETPIDAVTRTLPVCGS